MSKKNPQVSEIYLKPAPDDLELETNERVYVIIIHSFFITIAIILLWTSDSDDL